MDIVVKNSNEKYYIFIIIILNLILFLVSNYKYNEHISIYGTISNNEITFELSSLKFPLVVNKKLIISKKVYEYEIISSTPIYVLTDSYNQVVIKIKNNSFYKTGVIELQFIGGKTTFIEEISEYIKKGMVGWKN